MSIKLKINNILYKVNKDIVCKNSEYLNCLIGDGDYSNENIEINIKDTSINVFIKFLNNENGNRVVVDENLTMYDIFVLMNYFAINDNLIKKCDKCINTIITYLTQYLFTNDLRKIKIYNKILKYGFGKYNTRAIPYFRSGKDKYYDPCVNKILSYVKIHQLQPKLYQLSRIPRIFNRSLIDILHERMNTDTFMKIFKRFISKDDNDLIDIHKIEDHFTYCEPDTQKYYVNPLINFDIGDKTIHNKNNAIKRIYELSKGIIGKDFPFSNCIIAGGYANKCLIKHEYHQQYNDIDIFLYGKITKKKNAFITLLRYFSKRFKNRIFYCINKSALTLCIEDIDINLQIIYNNAKNKIDVISEFDLTYCQVLFDGKEFLAMYNYIDTAKSFMTTNSDRIVYVNTHRAQKAKDKGYTLYNNTYYHEVEDEKTKYSLNKYYYPRSTESKERNMKIIKMFLGSKQIYLNIEDVLSNFKYRMMGVIESYKVDEQSINEDIDFGKLDINMNESIKNNGNPLIFNMYFDNIIKFDRFDSKGFDVISFDVKKYPKFIDKMVKLMEKSNLVGRRNKSQIIKLLSGKKNGEPHPFHKYDECDNVYMKLNIRGYTQVYDEDKDEFVEITGLPRIFSGNLSFCIDKLYTQNVTCYVKFLDKIIIDKIIE